MIFTRLIVLICITGGIAGLGLLGYGLYLFGKKEVPKIHNRQKRRFRKKIENMFFENRIETALYSRYPLVAPSVD